MALATKCPQCGSLFRVVADQLKLRGGLVRCGQCHSVFDAIGSLTYLDDSVVAPMRTAKEEAPAARPAPEPGTDEAPATRHAIGRSTTLRISPVPPATLVRPIESPEAGQDEKPVDEAVEPIVVLPVATDDEARDTEEAERSPSFTRPKRRKRGGFSVVYGGGVALLALLAVIQLAVIFRGQLLIHWPQARPVLAELCGVFRCTVSWPMQADRLAVIGTELQAIQGTDALELGALIRNRAEFTQALPAIEVTLTDARNRPLARKVFTPADYLSSAGEPTTRLQEGLAPGGDLAIRIYFEARGLSPAGFLVYPFYL